MSIDDDLPVVFDRAAARRQGVPDSRISRLVDAGVWIRLRRGQLTASAFADDDLRWRAEVLAAVCCVPRPLVLSHAHAARAWGLPTPVGGPGPPTFVAVTGASRFAPRLVVRRAPLSDDETTRMGRIVVTSPARTVADCARTLRPHDALAVTDAALRSGLVTADELALALERARGWPGTLIAGRVVGLADGRRESALESWSAWSFHDNGVPSPQWQVTLLDAQGRFVARPDALWGRGLVGEADGKLKYRLAAAERGGVDAQNLLDVVGEERRREARLRRLGLALVRWGAGDVLDARRSTLLAEQLRAEIDRADPGRFLGRVVTA
jgi:hypothetical protein